MAIINPKSIKVKVSDQAIKWVKSMYEFNNIKREITNAWIKQQSKELEDLIMNKIN